MKKLLSTFALLACSLAAYSQNTFPSSGNVGIGTTTPSEKLVVHGNVKLSNGKYIYWDWPGRSIGQYFMSDGVSREIRFKNSMDQSNPLGGFNFTDHTNASVLKIINKKVGIGTTTPTGKFHVDAGNLTPDAFIFEGSNSSTSNGLNLTIRSTDGAFPLLKLANVYRDSYWNIENGRYGTGEVGFYKSGLGTAMLIDGQGKVGIGTLDPDYELDVIGTVRAREVIVSTEGADFVFAEDYELMPLAEVESHIAENGHLPDVPSAEEMQTVGVGVSELQTRLLQKVEELTLYAIQKEKEVEDLNKRWLVWKLCYWRSRPQKSLCR